MIGRISANLGAMFVTAGPRILADPPPDRRSLCRHLCHSHPRAGIRQGRRQRKRQRERANDLGLNGGK